MSVFAILALTKFVSPIPRYDLILLVCILVQWLMIRSRLESIDELKVISLFHLIGLVLEVWKVQHGSWRYPDEGILRIGDVPLYSGFMYSSVASYITQAWRRFDLSMRPLPPGWVSVGLVAIAYGNFFTNAYLPDIRWYVIGAVFLIYSFTRCTFTVNRRAYWLPLSAAFVLIAIFIYIAENLGTILGAWQYPNQHHGWTLVHESKISSWFVLIIISYLTVAWLKDVKAFRSSAY